MNDILKSFFALVVVALTSLVNATEYGGYLWWMLDEASVNEVTSRVGTPSYAKLHVSGGGKDYYMLNPFGGKEIYKDDAWGVLGVFQSAVAAEYATAEYKFIVELFDDSSNLLASFIEVAGDSFGNAYSDSFDPRYIYEFSGTNIPEPTGGMLTLVGFGLLALRRKQKKV